MHHTMHVLDASVRGNNWYEVP